jgi:hypothetical protein
MELNQADISNAVQQQYMELVDHINYAHEWEELRRAMYLLEFAAILWPSVGFAYKVENIKTRLRQKADQLTTEKETYLAGCRKNCRTRVSTERAIKELREIRFLVS